MSASIDKYGIWRLLEVGFGTTYSATVSINNQSYTVQQVSCTVKGNREETFECVVTVDVGQATISNPTVAVAVRAGNTEIFNVTANCSGTITGATQIYLSQSLSGL